MALTLTYPRRFDTSDFTVLTAAVKVLQGACTCTIVASGLATGGAFSNATRRFCGFALDTAQAGQRLKLKNKGRTLLNVTGAAAAKANAVVYASDDNTFTVTPAGGEVAIGRIAWVEEGEKAVVDFDASIEAGQVGTKAGAGGSLSQVGPDGFAMSSGVGPKTVLFGDSMTDFWEEGFPITAASFNSATGVLTCTLANHFTWTGKRVRVWSFTYPSIRVAQEVELTRISSSQFSLVLTGATDVPASPDATKFFIQGRSENQLSSWVGWLQMRLGHRLNIIKNLAQNGDTSIGLYARVNDLLALSPDLVLMQMVGINDESSALDNFPSEATTNSYNAQTITKILSSGAKLILLLITPVSSAETARANKASMGRVLRKNRFLREFCAGKPNVVIVDSYSKIIDPTNTTGLALSTMVRNDGIHYSVRGAAAVAALAQPAVEAWFPTTPGTLPESALDSGDGGKLTVSSMTSAADVVTVNSTAHGWRVGDTFFVKKVTETAANGVFTVKAVPNANSFTYDAPGTGTATLTAGSVVVTQSPQAFGNHLFLTATGGTLSNGVTGVAASKMQVSNQIGNTGTFTAVASVPAAQSGFGNEQLITVTAAAANDRPAINTFGTSSFMNDLQLGRKYRFEAMLRLASTAWANTPISEIYSNIYITWSTGEAYSIGATAGWDGVEAATIVQNETMHLRSGELSLNPPQPGATLSSATWTNYIRFSGALSGGATLVMGLSQLAITDVGAADA